jgi:hypothetical protein
METEQRATDAHAERQQTEKLYIENTLLRVSGALFCHDAKRAPTRIAEIKLSRGTDEKAIVIRPDPRLGQPGPLAHKLFVAIIKKHSDLGRPVQREVSFTKREIMRMVGRKTWGGRDSEELSRALHEIHYTFVTAHFRNGAGRPVEHSFNIFPEILIERREFASDPIEACTVTLAAPIVASLQDEHFVCLNHGLMQPLGTIGQALYMRLFFHLANLYDGANRQRLVFQKRYDDICKEWLGGLTVLEHRSKIVGEQLGHHLDALVNARFLTSYEIEGAKTKGSCGHVLTVQPGPVFFEDYDRFYRRRSPTRPIQETPANLSLANEPLRVAYLFAERRSGHPAASIAFVPSKDVETAKQLLTELTMAELPAFFDHALAEARKTAFDVQTLGGIKQYLAGYLAARVRHQAAEVQKAADQAREREEADQSAYERDRRAAVIRMFATLPAGEQAEIEAQAEAQVATFRGSLRNTMLAYRRVRITSDRHLESIQTFEEWAAARRRLE